MRKQKIVRKRKQSLEHDQQLLFPSENLHSVQRKSLSLRSLHNSYGTLPINPEKGLPRNKQLIIKDLVEQFRYKLSIDMSAREAIEKDNRHKYNRLKQIQAEIQAINNENQLKIEQLTQIQNTTLKKIENELNKDKQIQERLIYQYEKTMKEGEKINITQHVKHIKEKQDWIMLDQERRRLELLARSYEKKQLELARDKSLVPKVRRQLGHNKDDNLKQAKPAKKERKKKNIEELKQIGRQFLQHAKKVQAQKLKANTKILDVGKKSIDYLPQIKSILRNHGKDLSRPMPPEQIPSPRARKRKNPGRETK